MKKLLFTAAIAVFCLSLSAQDKSASAKPKASKDQGDPKGKNVKTDNNFMDRYYAIKDSYKDLPDVFGPYAASDQDMDKFMERYYSLKEGYPNLAKFAANYAAGKGEAKDFETRYHEIKEAVPELAPVRAEYAAAKNDLKDFTTRYHEAKAAYPGMDHKVYGAYAASGHKLDRFMERYNAIKASYPAEKNVFECYAGSDKKLNGNEGKKDNKAPKTSKSETKSAPKKQ